MIRLLAGSAKTAPFPPPTNDFSQPLRFSSYLLLLLQHTHIYYTRGASINRQPSSPFSACIKEGSKRETALRPFIDWERTRRPARTCYSAACCMMVPTHEHASRSSSLLQTRNDVINCIFSFFLKNIHNSK